MPSDAVEQSEFLDKRDGLRSLARRMRSLVKSLLFLGLDPRRLGRILHLPNYFSDLRKFKQMGGKVDRLYPILGENEDQAGAGHGAYFYQDLYYAQKIYQANPQRHVDVASSLGGFVAHVASYREIDVVDIRPLDSTISNVTFLQGDLMKESPELQEISDSVSCLHALEHFGLGRYGDPIDPQGHEKGLKSLMSIPSRS